MVEEFDADDFGGFADAASHAEVGIAGGRIAGGVIVDEDEAPGGVCDGGAEDIARMGHGFVDGAVGDLFLADETEAGIDEEDADGFVGEVAHFRAGELVDEFGCAEGLLDEGFAFGAANVFRPRTMVRIRSAPSSASRKARSRSSPVGKTLPSSSSSTNFRFAIR